MSYVDGFVLVVPKKNVSAYKKMASKAGEIWMDHGALQYLECAADDLKVPCGLPFPKLVKLKASETVFFSFIIYKSRKHRDTVNARVMKDKRMNQWDPKKMPFDLKRMAWGGFKALVEF